MKHGYLKEGQEITFRGVKPAQVGIVANKGKYVKVGDKLFDSLTKWASSCGVGAPGNWRFFFVTINGITQTCSEMKERFAFHKMDILKVRIRFIFVD